MIGRQLEHYKVALAARQGWHGVAVPGRPRFTILVNDEKFSMGFDGSGRATRSRSRWSAEDEGRRKVVIVALVVRHPDGEGNRAAALHGRSETDDDGQLRVWLASNRLVPVCRVISPAPTSWRSTNSPVARNTSTRMKLILAPRPPLSTISRMKATALP